MDNPNFQSLLFELVYLKAKGECGFSSKTKVVKYLSHILTLSHRTLKSIYLEESNNPQFQTLNILSMYLGYLDFPDFFSKKKPVLETLDLKSKNIAFRNPTFYNYEYFQKAFLLLRNEPKLFTYRIHEILDSIFPFTKTRKSSLFMVNSISLHFDGSDLLFCVLPFSLTTSFEDVLVNYKVILEEIKTDKEIVSNSSILLVFTTNLILTVKQKKIIEEQTNIYLKESFKGKIDFLDIEDFLEFYSFKLDGIIDDILEEYHLQYKGKISQDIQSSFYIKDIPFTVSKSNRIYENPLSYIKKNSIGYRSEFGMLGNRVFKISGEESLSRNIKWNIITGEFGFGKTTLFLNLEEEFRGSQYKVFFLPLAQLDENAFDNIDSFLSQLFLIIKEKSLDHSNANDLLFYDYLKSVLIKEQRIMFLIDGIDEHIAAYSKKGLQNIFNRINELQVDCLISLRKEFWDDRTGDLISIFSKYRKYNSLIELIDWSNHQIINYIEEFESHENVTNNNKIIEFKELIKNNKSEEVFGDIPKRPLFLKMILQDAVLGNLKTKSLNTLYENYLIEKFTRDREGSFVDNKTGRLLELENNTDKFAIINSIWQIMKLVAGEMVTIENNELKLNSFIYEDTLNTIIKDSTINISSIEILLNSVLIPLTQRTLEGLKLIFAHRSFQEYFTALYLKKERVILNSNILIPKGVAKFI